MTVTSTLSESKLKYSTMVHTLPSVVGAWLISPPGWIYIFFVFDMRHDTPNKKQLPRNARNMNKDISI